MFKPAAKLSHASSTFRSCQKRLIETAAATHRYSQFQTSTSFTLTLFGNARYLAIFSIEALERNTVKSTPALPNRLNEVCFHEARWRHRCFFFVRAKSHPGKKTFACIQICGDLVELERAQKFLGFIGLWVSGSGLGKVGFWAQNFLAYYLNATLGLRDLSGLFENWAQAFGAFRLCSAGPALSPFQL